MTTVLQKLALTSIRKNKARTLSTATGIALAVILMTVVVILATSISSSMIAGAAQKYGNWHIMSDQLTREQLNEMQNDGIIDSVCYVKNLGYARIDDPADAAKPYIHIADVSQNFGSFLSCEITDGRMAENGDEIVITEKFHEDYPDIGIGSLITINLGQRISSAGSTLWQNASYLGADGEYILQGETTAAYTVVGIAESIDDIEYSFSPGYTLITCGVDGAESGTKVYINLNNLSSNISVITKYISEENIVYNTALLSYLGVTNGENLQSLLISIVCVLVVIIGLAAFVLINNSLMTSSDERSKQFGILFSIGMTRAQTLLMFITEVLAIGIFSIIAGVGAGIAFAYLCLNTIGYLIISASYLDIPLAVNVNLGYVAIIAAISLAILLIAAAFNAARQMNGSAISKMRKNDAIKLPKERKHSQKFYDSLSVEWGIVLKNFKRYNKKYRYVLISMSLSAVLFISAGLFGQYAQSYVQKIMPTVSYDITVTSRGSDIFDIIGTQFEDILSLNEINGGGWLSSVSAGIIKLDEIDLNESYKTYADSRNITTAEVTYIFISDESYAEISDNTGENYGGVYAFDNMSFYVDGEQYTSNLFSGDSANLSLYYMDDIQRGNYYQTGELEGNSTLIETEIRRVQNKDITIELEYITESYGLFLVIPVSRIYEFVTQTPETLLMLFSANDHYTAAQKISSLGEANNWTLSVTDVAESYEKEKSTYALYEVFAMIFTILISFVAIINAFNAVSSNMIKRRKEFAVMQSVGLQNKSFYKLIANECILLCSIVLLITLTLTPIISALLSLSFPLKTHAFIFPWRYLLIAAAATLIVFAAAMIKPVSAIKKQNIIETIKGDSD